VTPDRATHPARRSTARPVRLARPRLARFRGAALGRLRRHRLRSRRDGVTRRRDVARPTATRIFNRDFLTC
jgi:hypothetical protein